MAVCAIFNCPNLHPNNYVLSDHLLFCNILVNKHEGATIVDFFGTKFVQIKSHHIWMFYLPPQQLYENDRFNQNGFIQMEIRFHSPLHSWFEFKKCGFRLV